MYNKHDSLTSRHKMIPDGLFSEFQEDDKSQSHANKLLIAFSQILGLGPRQFLLKTILLVQVFLQSLDANHSMPPESSCTILSKNSFFFSHYEFE